MVASAGIVLLLGLAHLAITFRGTKLLPRDPALQASMIHVSPVLTKRTTMWRAWVGFNASHAMGAILFGLVYGYLATIRPDLLFASPYLLGVGFAMLAGYVALARAYWFRVPYLGVGISLACFVASVAASRF